MLTLHYLHHTWSWLNQILSSNHFYIKSCLTWKYLQFLSFWFIMKNQFLYTFPLVSLIFLLLFINLIQINNKYNFIAFKAIFPNTLETKRRIWRQMWRTSGWFMCQQRIQYRWNKLWAELDFFCTNRTSRMTSLKSGKFHLQFAINYRKQMLTNW